MSKVFSQTLLVYLVNFAWVWHVWNELASSGKIVLNTGREYWFLITIVTIITCACEFLLSWVYSRFKFSRSSVGKLFHKVWGVIEFLTVSLLVSKVLKFITFKNTDEFTVFLKNLTYTGIIANIFNPFDLKTYIYKFLTIKVEHEEDDD